MKLQHVRFALFHVFQSDLSLGNVAFVERNFVSDIKYLSYRYLVNGNGLQATSSSVNLFRNYRTYHGVHDRCTIILSNISNVSKMST